MTHSSEIFNTSLSEVQCSQLLLIFAWDNTKSLTSMLFIWNCPAEDF